MLESQTNYALDALRTMRARGAADFEVRAEAQDAYNEEIPVARHHVRVPPPHAPVRPAAYRLAAPTTLSSGNGASRSHPPTHAR